MPPKSKAQARFLGLIAGGGHPRKKGGPSQARAKEMLRGSKLKGLPQHAKKKKTARRRRR